jgi:hypothetical protein
MFRLVFLHMKRDNFPPPYYIDKTSSSCGKILLNCTLKKGYPSYKVTCSLQKGVAS